MNHIEQLAPDILRGFGADFSCAKRAGGWTNHVWIVGNLVLRISPDRNGERIRREVEVSMRLPKAVGYPEVLQTGCINGHEWSISRRVPGVNLAEAWPELTWNEREKALVALWKIMEEIHKTDARGMPFQLPRRTWYSDLRHQKACADLAELVAQNALEQGVADALRKILDAFFGVFGRAERCLCHGDITMENMMWHNGKIASVFDFEHAAILPAQADVYSFLRFVLGPDCENAPEQVVRFVAALVKARIHTEDEVRLLLGFAVLISMRHMHIWIEGDESGPVADWAPYRCLSSLADGRGGFLWPVIERAAAWGHPDAMPDIS